MGGVKNLMGDLKASWAAVLVGAVVAAVIAVVAVDAGEAEAATTATTRATVQATQFTVQQGQSGDEFAVCGGKKRAVGAGVVQSGAAESGMRMLASGPLDASGVTLQTNTGDVAKQWYAAVGVLGDTQRQYKVLAICGT